MLAENVFPPIPSEVILPLAGYTAAQGRGSLWVVAIAGTLGSAAGAVLWYYVGRWIGIERLKRFASRHGRRSEEHTSELQSLMRISYAVFCLKKNQKQNHQRLNTHTSQSIIRQYQ